MERITRIAEMQAWSDRQRADGRRVGFVPTMGYLHDGHLSLVTEAKRRASAVVVSIFVNPLQFGAGEDLERYPSDLEGDAARLEAAGTDVLFLPPATAMYPKGFQTSVMVENLTRGLCGLSRPTHFRGVTTVVTKLFHQVRPDVAIFGEKDFQQLAAIRRLVLDLDFGIEIVGGPTVREADGVAMSSRNSYLNPAERTAATCLSRALGLASDRLVEGVRDAATIRSAAATVIAAEPLARLDYLELVDELDLEPVATIERPAVLAVAAFVGRTRLIDNWRLDPERPVALFPKALAS